jgi:hypothetical protein
MDWQSFLNSIEEQVKPQRVAEQLTAMAQLAEGDEEAAILATVATTMTMAVEPAGLAAAYVLPPENPSAALKMVADRLSHLDFESGMNELPKKERKRVAKFIAAARPLYGELGQMMQAVLGAYARNEYDLNANPNDLILAAERALPQDLSAALSLVGRAGAMGLRGKRWWWRWDQELAAPLTKWITLAGNLVDDLTLGGEPFGPIEQERATWHAFDAEEAQDEPVDDSVLAEVEKELQATDEVDELIDRLYEGEHALTDDLEKAFAARRDEAIPLLMEVAEDEELWREESPGQGWVSIHAVELLGKLRAQEAVPTLIDIIAASESADIIQSQAMFALEKIGSPAAPAVLDTIHYTRDRDLKANLAPILGKVGRGRADTFDTLAALFKELKWDEFRIFAVMGMADLGDRRAIPILEQALNDPELSEMDRREVIGVLEEFGARPKTRAPNLLPFLESPRTRPAKLGRNDPCWCGSGKKYKHCHLASDEESESKGRPR